MHEIFSKALIERYLLGQATESERTQIEERLMFDNEFEDVILEVEYDLIDQYLAGEAIDRSGFAKLMCTPEQQLKLRVSMALRSYDVKTEETDDLKFIKGNTPLSWFKTWLGRREPSPLM
jgi:hypothetical protein